MCLPAAGGGGGFGLGADTLGSIGTGMQLAGMVTGAFGAYRQARSERAAYEYQAAVNRNNATIAEWQAQDAIARGQQEEQTQRLRSAALRSSQRAGFAARGVSLDEGSPLAILDDTEYMGEMDALTIRDNAAREAWGHRVQAGNYSNDASMLSDRADSVSPGSAAFSTLLTGASAVADSWYRRSRSTSRS